MAEYVDPTPTRVDYMKWADTQFIHAVVEDIRTLSKKHTIEEMERHVRAVVTEIDDRFEGKLSPDAYHTIVLALRSYALFVRGNDDETNTNQSLSTTQLIIKIVQGDNKMDKNTLQAMVYRCVIEAMNKAEHGAVNGYEPGPMASDIAEDTAVRIIEDVFGGKTPAEIQEFVPQFYEMDPKTEDVLHNGTLLMDGMKVLIENPMLRTQITDDMDPSAVNDARMKNRWCTVEHCKVEKTINGTEVSFVAVYEDGVKRKRSLVVNHAWIVKKDSIPRIDTLMTVEGGFLESMPTAKMVGFLKDRIKTYTQFDPRQMKIQTGVDGDVIPLDDYLIAEGLQAGPSESVFTVTGPQGNIAFNGTRMQIVEFLKGMDEACVGFFKVKPMGSQRPSSAAKFLKDNVATFEVWDEEGSRILEGNIGRILEWAKWLPGNAADDTALKYAGYTVSRVGAVDGYTLEQFVAQWEVK